MSLHARLRVHLTRGGAALAAAWLAATWAPVSSAAAGKPEDHFTRNWYYTEVVVFQRPRVQDHAADERLARAPVPLSRSMRSFLLPAGERWNVYRLHPETHAYLTFPYLDHDRLREDEATTADLDREEELTRPGSVEPPGITPSLAPDPLVEFLNQVAAFEERLDQASYRWLEADTFTLRSQAATLTRRGGFQVILHGRWLQPVPARGTPEPMLIQAGARYGDVFGLEGTFDVTLGRYLHFRAHLLYTEPLLGQRPITRPLPPPEATSAGLGEAAARTLSEQDLTPRGFMQLFESRRVRAGELHYLDHPKLGVLVRIDPVTAPESLGAAFQALE